MRLITINEALTFTSIDHDSAPENCEYCNKPGDLRPYGKDGAWICVKCGLSPENVEQTESSFQKVLDGEQTEGVKTSKV